MFITKYIRWKDTIINHNGVNMLHVKEAAIRDIPAAVYQEAGLHYPKFFKMDILSRVAITAAELLDIPLNLIEDKTRVATVFSTASGCIDVDKKFEDSRQKIASPALFVYTLPNIMLGELCIKYGFKGAQICFISQYPDAAQTFFYVNDLFAQGKIEACLCGHIEATDQGIDASLLWVSRQKGPVAFTETEAAKIYQ